jgi:hypothetical protein
MQRPRAPGLLMLTAAAFLLAAALCPAPCVSQQLQVSRSTRPAVFPPLPPVPRVPAAAAATAAAAAAASAAFSVFGYPPHAPASTAPRTV